MFIMLRTCNSFTFSNFSFFEPSPVLQSAVHGVPHNARWIVVVDARTLSASSAKCSLCNLTRILTNVPILFALSCSVLDSFEEVWSDVGNPSCLVRLKRPRGSNVNKELRVCFSKRCNVLRVLPNEL